MTEKTEALRLAEQLEAIGLHGPVTAELRRLVAEVERLSWDSVHTCHAECQRPVCRLTRERDALRQIVQDFPPIEAELAEVSDRAHRLETQRDALLEALQDLMQQYKDQPECFMDWSKARAAIAKAEGEKT